MAEGRISDVQTTGQATGPVPAERLCVGIVTGVKGLRGEVRIKSFTDQPKDMTAYGPLTDEAGARTYDLRVVAMAKGQLIARLAGVDNRNAAEALKGTRFYVPRGALPATDTDEFYEADLVGLRAVLVSGATLGTVRGVADYGAGPVLEIGAEDGGEVLVPFTQAVVPHIHVDTGRLIIDPPLGLLEEPPEALPEALPEDPAESHETGGDAS